MRICNKVALLLLAAALLLSAVIFLAVSSVLGHETADQEEAQFIRDMYALVSELDNRGEALVEAGERLAGLARGAEGVPDLSAAADAAFLLSHDVDYLLALDGTGSVVFSRGVGRSGEAYEPVPPAISRRVQAVLADTPSGAPVTPGSGFAVGGGLPLFLATAEAGGEDLQTLVLAVNADRVLDALGGFVRGSVQIRPGGDFETHGGTDSVDVQVGFGSLARATTLLENPFSAAPLEMTAVRVAGQGRSTLVALATLLLAGSACLALVARAAVGRMVGGRANRIGAALTAVRESGGPSGEPVTTGRDELGQLGREINEALASIDARGEAIRRNEGRLRAVLEGAAEGIIVIDETGTILMFNSAAESIFEYASDEVIGENVRTLMPEPYKGHHDEYIEQYRGTGMARIIGKGREVLGQKKGGKAFPIHISVSEAEVNGERLFTAIVRDITQHKVAERSLRRAATRDVLTGLMNRGAFEKELDAAIESAKISGHALCLCMCDIDMFKSVNDLYGHQAGDDVLRKMGEMVRQEVRRDDLAGRFGGDEFCICFTQAPAIEAIAATERIRERFGSYVFGRERGQPLFFAKATFGLADLVSHEMDAKALFKAADSALYKAKERGRNQSYINDD